MKSLPRLMYGMLVLAVWMGYALLAGQAMAQSAPKVHDLKAAPDTVHRGFFDATLKPVLTIDSGDIVRLETATGNPRYFEKLGVPKEQIPAELYRVFEGVDDARRWVAAFVHWYIHEHQHSGIGFVTPADRHAGLDVEILAARRCVYERARQRRPERWSRTTRSWSRPDLVTLNPENTTSST